MDGCWRGVGGREKRRGAGLVAGAATATAGRNSKNYHSYVFFILSECMISPI